MTPVPFNFPDVQQDDDFFEYSIEFDALAAGDVQQGNIQIQQDSDFYWVKSQYQANIDGNSDGYTYLAAPIPLVTVQIVDQTSQWQLFFSPVPVSSCFGRGILPFILPRPRKFVRLSAIGITVSNFSAATTYDLRLVFSGIKSFGYGGRALR